MVRRKMIRIDEEKCDGCGACVPNCPEGALQIVDGKARIVSETYCDGLGACIGDCPKGAISVEEREAEEYDEWKVMENLIRAGRETTIAHLKHLHHHGERELLHQAFRYLEEKGYPDIVEEFKGSVRGEGGGPTTVTPVPMEGMGAGDGGPTGRGSRLTHWPVQMHLIDPRSPHFRGADLLLAADCTAYAAGNFHDAHLKGKSLVIACPKLDSGREEYIEKLVAMIDEAGIRSLTLLMMEVPCCRGLLALVKEAMEGATRTVPVDLVILGISGRVLERKRFPDILASG